MLYLYVYVEVGMRLRGFYVLHGGLYSYSYNHCRLVILEYFYGYRQRF